MMGTSIAMSFHAARSRDVSKWKLFCRILRRTAILFVLGLAISNHGMMISHVVICYLAYYSVCVPLLALSLCLVSDMDYGRHVISCASIFATGLTCSDCEQVVTNVIMVMVVAEVLIVVIVVISL